MFCVCPLEVESFSGRVEQPGVVVGALEAGVKAKRLSGQFSGGEGASVGQGAVRLGFNVALVLPLGVVAEGGDVDGILHPLDNLKFFIFVKNAMNKIFLNVAFKNICVKTKVNVLLNFSF